VSISLSTFSRNDVTTASLYSGPSSSCAAAAAQISCGTAESHLCRKRSSLGAGKASAGRLAVPGRRPLSAQIRTALWSASAHPLSTAALRATPTPGRRVTAGHHRPGGSGDGRQASARRTPH
jgi:hypothetical protein